MIYRKIVLFCLLAIVLSVGGALAYMGMGGNLYEDRPMVDLFSPVTDNIDLSGKQELEFKWRRFNLPSTDHYQFKLYSGYDMLESTLLIKEDIAPDKYPFSLPVKAFEIDKAYTWSLIQVYRDGSKSDKSSSPFKVVKK